MGVERRRNSRRLSFQCILFGVIFGGSGFVILFRTNVIVNLGATVYVVGWLILSMRHHMHEQWPSTMVFCPYPNMYIRLRRHDICKRVNIKITKVRKKRSTNKPREKTSFSIF